MKGWVKGGLRDESGIRGRGRGRGKEEGEEERMEQEEMLVAGRRH